MVTNNGNTEGLFRGGVMVSSSGSCCSLYLLTTLKPTKESGSVFPTQDLSAGQPYYDSIVNQTGCARSSDTLACLRTVPFQDLFDAVNQLLHLEDLEVFYYYVRPPLSLNSEKLTLPRCIATKSPLQISYSPPSTFSCSYYQRTPFNSQNG